MQHLKSIIDKVKRNATSLSEVEAYEQQEAMIIREFLSHKLSSEQYEAKLNRLTHEPQRVICKTVEELKFVLDYLGVSEKEQQDLFEHEKAHFNEAKANGLQARFCLTFYRTASGFGLIPGTQVHATLLNTLSDDERRMGVRTSITAPKNMSEADMQMLL